MDATGTPGARVALAEATEEVGTGMALVKDTGVVLMVGTGETSDGVALGPGTGEVDMLFFP